jgi:hypothetical protein
MEKSNINVPKNKKKYLTWIQRELKKEYKIEDLQGTVEFFHNNIDKFEEKDIFKWDGKQLEDHIKDTGMYSKRAVLKSKKEEDAEKIYEDDEWLVVCPKNLEACVTYGKGTKWCISMAGANYYNQYREENNTFHFIIDKTAKNQSKFSKVAIVCKKDNNNKISDIEYYLSNDKCVTFDKLNKRIREFLSK